MEEVRALTMGASMRGAHATPCKVCVHRNAPTTMSASARGAHAMTFKVCARQSAPLTMSALVHGRADARTTVLRVSACLHEHNECHSYYDNHEPVAMYKYRTLNIDVQK